MVGADILGIGQIIATGAAALDPFFLTDQEKLQEQTKQQQAAAVVATAEANRAAALAKVESSKQIGLYFVLGAGLLTAGVVAYAVMAAK